MAEPAFSGFPKETFDFLRGLGANNAKPWFDAHRADYDAYYMAPARAFVMALGPKLKKISPGVSYEPKVNGSIFRINRDVRFSKDKTPYRTNLDLWFWHGERGGWAGPGFFFRLGADAVSFGVGMHMFQKPQLDAFRKAVLAPTPGKALVKTIDGLTTGGYEVKGATRKTVPRGFDAAHERAGLLLHEGLWTEGTARVAAARKADFPDVCAREFAAMWPLGKWLLAEVTGQGPAR